MGRYDYLTNEKARATYALVIIAFVVVIILVVVVLMVTKKDKYSVSWDMSSLPPAGRQGAVRPGWPTDFELMAPLTRYSEALGGESAGTANQMQVLSNRPPAYSLPPQVGEQIGPLEYTQYEGLPANWNLPSLPIEVSSFSRDAAGTDHYDTKKMGATPAIIWSRPVDTISVSCGGSKQPGYDLLQIPDREPLVGPDSF